MTLTWMLSAVSFTACLSLAAAAAEPLVRTAGRPIRWHWAAALVAAVLWPMLALTAGMRSITTKLPSLHVVPEHTAPLASAWLPWGALATRAALLIWMSASLILAARLIRAGVALRVLRRRAERRVVDGVPVLLTDRIGPATIGLYRPVVLVPRDLLHLDESLRRLVLRHEREHCDAHDPWLLLAAAIAVVLVPWNVALWYVARRLRLAVEIDCDTRVLSGGADETRYGQLLLWVAHGRVALPIAPALAAPHSHLERRITAMRTRFARPHPLHVLGSTALILMAIAGACSAAAPDVPAARQAAASTPQRIATAAASKDSFVEFKLDKGAQQVAGTGAVRYPAAMRKTNREGEVLAQFVVDPSGAVIVSTYKVLKSSDPAFTQAVRAALPTMRFTPAVVSGRPVSQLVQQPFTFALDGTTRSAP